jgi:signal transduction histidine kinase
MVMTLMAKTDEMLRVAKQEQKSQNQNRIDSDYFLLLTQAGLLVFFVFDIFFSKSYEKPSILIMLLPILAVVNMFFIRSGLRQNIIRPVSQFVYYAILFILLVFILPVFGIYLILLPYILFTSIYWYGFKGLFYGLCAIVATIAIGGIYQFDQINAQLLWLIARTSVLFGFGGIVLWRVLKTDFVERQKLGSVQKDSGVERDRMRALINSMDYAVIATNQKGLINLYNGAALSLLNTNKTPDSQPLKEIASIVDSEGMPVDLIETASQSNGSLHRKDVLLRFDDDDKVNLEVSVSAVRPSYGQRIGEGYVITLKDITKQHSLEEERDDFIAVTSHELRTPIAITEANLSTALLEKMSDGMQEKN